jgi:hypothetical protein
MALPYPDMLLSIFHHVLFSRYHTEISLLCTGIATVFTGLRNPRNRDINAELPQQFICSCQSLVVQLDAALMIDQRMVKIDGSSRRKMNKALLGLDAISWLYGQRGGDLQ